MSYDASNTTLTLRMDDIGIQTPNQVSVYFTHPDNQNTNESVVIQLGQANAQYVYDVSQNFAGSPVQATTLFTHGDFLTVAIEDSSGTSLGNSFKAYVQDTIFGMITFAPVHDLSTINNKDDLFVVLADVFGATVAEVQQSGNTFTATRTVTTPIAGSDIQSYYQGNYGVILQGVQYTAQNPGTDGFATEWWNQDGGVKTGISRPPYDNWEYVQAIHSTPGTANFGTNMMKWDGDNTFSLALNMNAEL